MLNISQWIPEFLTILDKTFGDRVFFVGLQGSYGRGEATESSDIDLVVILDEMTVTDVQTYNSMLNALDYRNLICGFISGKNDIMNWEPSDLFQFYHDTTPLRGSLDQLLSLIDEASVRRAVKIGACNIYHGCVHNMLYEKSDEILKGLYKSASFVIQAITFLKTGKYYKYQKDLLENISDEEKKVIETFISFKNGENPDFAKDSEELFNFAKKWISKV